MLDLTVLQSAQYITVKDERFVLINVDDWESLIEQLETIEDIEIAQKAFTDLGAVNGDRSQAGWLRWNDVKDELK